tara:strand:+ start:1429 stop:1761 length:333 start_codon:yes stop_codon:yes gene_type:complete
MANTFKNDVTQNIGTSGSAQYTAGGSVTATIIGMTCANTTNADIKCNVQVTDNSAGVTSYVVKNAPIPTEGSLVVVGGNQKIVLEPNDSIKVTSSASSSIDLVLSVMEQT